MKVQLSWRKWSHVSRPTILPHQHPVFLDQGWVQTGEHHDSTLHYTGDAWWIFYETIAGKPFPPFPWRDHRPLQAHQYLKLHHCRPIAAWGACWKTRSERCAPVQTNNSTKVMTQAAEKNNVTWADIVRNGTPVKGENQSVVSSLFSWNNPVSKG